MVIDAWEHAYYLQYKNAKTEFFKAVWNLWNWDGRERPPAAAHADVQLQVAGARREVGSAAASPRMGLREYYRKRDFKKTPEPRGKEHSGARASPSASRSTRPRGCTTTSASSWTACSRAGPCPRGRASTPPTSGWPCRPRTIPLEYGDFEGIIPEGEYGGGTVLLWDRGTWEPLEDPHKGFAQGRAQVPARRREAAGRLDARADVKGRDPRDEEQDLAADQGARRARAARLRSTTSRRRGRRA